MFVSILIVLLLLLVWRTYFARFSAIQCFTAYKLHRTNRERKKTVRIEKDILRKKKQKIPIILYHSQYLTYLLYYIDRNVISQENRGLGKPYF